MVGKDLRAEIKIDPKVELKDYSGPFKPDLRYSDFSREQLVRMYLMAAEYIVESIIADSTYVAEKYGAEAMLELEGEVWRNRMPGPVYRLITEAMGIKGNDIESFMKALQIDTTYCPVERRIGAYGGTGSKYDITFELPSKDRGLLTVNRCPGLDMVEALGQGDRMKEFCMAAGVGFFEEYAKLFNPDIVTNILVLPPRKSKDDICCKFEFTYKSK